MSRNSNSTRGKGTPGSRGHGKTESEKQRRDKEALKALYGKTKNVRFVRLVADPERTDALAPTDKEQASFPSNFAVLRRDEHDNLGYRIPRLIPGPHGEEVPMPEHRGRKPDSVLENGKDRKNEKMPEPYTKIRPGQPDLDAGVDGWIQPEDTEDFVTRGNRVDSLLETFHRLSDRIEYRKDENGEFVRDAKGRKIEERRIQHAKAFRAETSVLETQTHSDGVKSTKKTKTDASTVSYRDTIGAAPYLSRALQHMVKDGLIEEARLALEKIPEPLGRFYEQTYRGPHAHAKVNSFVFHLDSGHAHADLWPHTTYLTKEKTGVHGEETTVRRWDARASCHYGPGPGVTFWMRHFEALGDLEELAKVEPDAARAAGYTKMLCDKALDGCRARAEESYKKGAKKQAEALSRGEKFLEWIKPPDDYARDVRMANEMDRLLIWAIGDLGLEKDYVAIGKAEYREHLIAAYKDGTTGIRRDTPEDLEHIRKLVELSEEKARKDREAAEKALLEAQQLNEDAQRIRRQAETLRTGIDADVEAAKKARADAEGARKRIIDEAHKEAAPVLEDLRNREADLEKLEESAKLQGVSAAFEAVFPNKKPEAMSPAEILVDIRTGIKALQDEAVELQIKASLWDRAEALIRRVVEFLPEKLRAQVDEATAGDPGIPDLEIKTMPGLLSRLSRMIRRERRVEEPAQAAPENDGPNLG